MTLISGLVKFISERSLSGKKSQFLYKVVFAVTLRLPFTTLGIFWVLTNWRCYCRTKVQISPGKNDKVYKDQENISVDKQEFLLVKKDVHLPWRFQFKIISRFQKTSWLQKDTHEVILILNFYEVWRIQKNYLRKKTKKK